MVQTCEPRSARIRLTPGFTARVNLAADLLVVMGATFAAHAWVWGLPLGSAKTTLFWTGMALVSAWVITAAAVRHYASFAYERSVLDDAAMITTQVAAMITVLSLLELFVGPNAPLPPIPVFLVMVWAPAVFFRLVLFRAVAGREEPIEEVLLVGIGPIARLTAQDMRQRGRHRVIGHLRLPDENGKETAVLQRSYAADGAECRILGPADSLEDTLRTQPVDEVYLAANSRKSGDEMQEAIRTCEKYGIPFALPAYAFRLERAQMVDARAIPDGYLHYQSTQLRPSQVAMKRLFDIVASGIALWLLMPLFLLVMAAIKLSSRGPIFFRQVRVGMHGRTFNMLKFRSMVTDAEQLKATLASLNEQSGPVFKMRKDPRVTRVGRFIRRYSIDELPQLINVLRGDMSVVGPRPPVPDEVLKYEPWQRRRLSVRPGLTCIWQVSGRNQISFEQWMYLDMQYIDHWSLARDFHLIFRTVPVVISGRGAS
jgi:exopolysaccharide biosynthesis polyprenyl glycosylphosphotransferase